jgi:PleD family two-component response regulator
MALTSTSKNADSKIGGYQMGEVEDPIKITTPNIKTNPYRSRSSVRSEPRHLDFKVLVIDDDDTICDSTAAILTAVGYRVSRAGDGMTAMSRLATDGYKVVITDLETPMLNGYRLCTWLKKESPETHTIIMTGKRPSDVAKFMITGLVDHWIFKPFRVHELYGALDSLGLPIYPCR